MLITRIIIIIGFVFSCLHLVACGGGGSGGSSDRSLEGSGDSSGDSSSNQDDDNAQPADQGYFIDAPVVGLSYETRDRDGTIVKGETGPNGEYPRYANRAIYFSLGKLALGTVSEAPITTPYSFVTASGSEKLPLNMARFLQTLDADGNPENGIEISQTAKDAFTDTSKSFAEDYFSQGSFTAQAEDDLQFLLNDPAISLVSEQAAQSHLSSALGQINETVSLPGTRWRTDLSPVTLQTKDSETGNWVARQTCTDQDYGLYRIDDYDTSWVITTHWDEFEWIPRCKKLGSEQIQPARDYDKQTLCGYRLAEDANANITSCSFADLNGVVIYTDDANRNITIYSAYTPGTGVVYRTIYKEYDEDDITYREKWQSITTQLLED